MKTTEQVCREFGFEYAPMRIVVVKKRNVRLRDLTPQAKIEREQEQERQREFMSRLASIVMAAFVFVVLLFTMIGYILSR